MPIWVDPDQSKKVVLTEDKELGDAAPWFELGVPTASQQDAILATFVESQSDTNLEDAIEAAQARAEEKLAEREAEEAGEERPQTPVGAARAIAKSIPWGIVTRCLRASLKGWGNWQKPNGEPVPFETDGDGLVTERCLSQLASGARMALFMHAAPLLGLIGTERD